MHDKRDTGIVRRIDVPMEKVSTGGLHSTHMSPADLSPSLPLFSPVERKRIWFQ